MYKAHPVNQVDIFMCAENYLWIIWTMCSNLEKKNIFSFKMFFHFLKILMLFTYME